MLFSATIPPEIATLSRRYMRDPEQVQTRAHVKHELLKQYYCDVLETEKFSVLAHLLETEKPQSAIIFCGTRTTAESVAHNLGKNGYEAQVIHGGLSQKQRDETMLAFREGRIKLLVATDLASRGLDIAGVTHIFNYGVSENQKDYTHRIGRTARAGNAGKSVSLISPRDHDAFRRVLRDPELEVHKIELGQFRQIPYTHLHAHRLPYSRRGGPAHHLHRPHRFPGRPSAPPHHRRW
jgi:ATP-dependent RNA helicase DeaD